MKEGYLILKVKHFDGDYEEHFRPMESQSIECRPTTWGMVEQIWLHPSRIISEEELEGRLHDFINYVLTFHTAQSRSKIINEAKQILLAPETPEKERDEWEKWWKEKPVIDHYSLEDGFYNVNKIEQWLKRMPRR